ncbi:MAG: sodium:proton antiporter [Alphaproteobacteria bacterium]|nr:MAG: sodium:proton antiporter [Alphaproteobacteria bacterium]
MTVTSLLALFALLAVSCMTYFAAARFKVPYTVLLVAVGLLLVPVANLAPFAFLKDFPLTPELLFYIFLPILIFESAYNIRVRKLQENVVSISLLAVVSLLLSTAFIAVALHFALVWMGMPVHPLVLLLFGALISATDPVAVLALFKEYGAPRRLSLIFEGESLFNDGTAVALFLILLEVAAKGYHGVETIGEGLFLFSSMVVGGIVFGLAMGFLFSKLIQATRSNENVSIILMLVLAHLTFILAEVISHHFVIAGFEIKISAIIATTIASIVMGNYGRYKVDPHAEEFVEKFWGQFAFMCNSLVFILMGLIFASLPMNLTAFLLPIIVTIAVVAVGRALSIYPVVGFINALKVEERIPMSWQHLMAWGSLRGALAITMVLMIPNDWIPEGWVYEYTPKQFIMALTIGCIYATLFIKAITIGPLVRKMGLSQLTEVEKIEYRDASCYIHAHAMQRIAALKDKGYVDAASYDKLCAQLGKVNEEALKRFKISDKPMLAHAALNIHALGIERYYLHDLFMHGEVSDWIVRRIQAMISNQIDKLENGEVLAEHPGSVKGDWLDLMVDFAHRFMPHHREKQFIETFLYYRAKTIITRKVIKEMKQLSADNVKLFPSEDVKPVIDRYTAYNKAAEAQVATLVAQHGAELAKVNVKLAGKAVDKHQHQLLDDLLYRELITPKVYVSLKHKIEA